MTELSKQDLSILSELDDVWVTFDEIYVPGVSLRTLRNRLVSLRYHGYVDSRISDAHGRVEYAITEKGDEILDR